MPRPRITGPSQRSLRVGEIIRHVLAEILTREELLHPDLYGVTITISEVRMSPDLKHARVYCVALGGGAKSVAGAAKPSRAKSPSAKSVADALNEVAKPLRARLGRNIQLKFTPELHFIEDRSFDEADRISRLVDSCNNKQYGSAQGR